MASIKKRADGMYRARYRDAAGKEHARHFTRKIDAQHWLDQVTASIVTGQYVDPRAGKITFSAYFADYAKRQVLQSGTEAAVRLAAGSVTFADAPLRALRRSHVEQWVKAMQSAGLAPGTIRTRYGNVRGSERTVYAPARLVDILAGHVAAHCAGEDPDRWLFGDGRPVPPGTVGKMWRAARRKAGCDGMHLHHLRHYYASGLIAAGCDVVTVQRALGHRTASVTLGTLCALVADGRGPHPRRRGGDALRSARFCGLGAD